MGASLGGLSDAASGQRVVVPRSVGNERGLCLKARRRVQDIFPARAAEGAFGGGFWVGGGSFTIARRMPIGGLGGLRGFRKVGSGVWRAGLRRRQAVGVGVGVWVGVEVGIGVGVGVEVDVGVGVEVGVGVDVGQVNWDSSGRAQEFVISVIPL